MCVRCAFSLFSLFWAFYAITVLPFIRRSQGSTLGFRPLSTRRRFASRKSVRSQIFSPTVKALWSLHPHKCLFLKNPRALRWKWAFSTADSTISSLAPCDIVVGHGHGIGSSLVCDSVWMLVQRNRVSGPFSKSKMLQFTTASRTDLISFSLQTLDTCFICLEEEFNMRKTLCCGQTAHMRCIHNWIRTLIPSSVRCPGCRGDYAFPLTPEEEQNLHTFSNSWNACDKTIQTIQNQILSLSVI